MPIGPLCALVTHRVILITHRKQSLDRLRGGACVGQFLWLVHQAGGLYNTMACGAMSMTASATVASV